MTLRVTVYDDHEQADRGVMRKSRFSESQIAGILKEAEAGIPIPNLRRRYAEGHPGCSRTLDALAREGNAS